MKLKGKKEIKKEPNKYADIISFVITCYQDGDSYRSKFKNKWDTIEQQIRCVHPDAWDDKEDWQTKVFVPQQAKTVESANAYLDKMLFGNKRFFNIAGVENNDRKSSNYIMELYDNILDRGNFFIENDFILNESSSIGTAFLKLLVNPNRMGLQFIWRSPYNITLDPECGHKLEKARYIIDEYKKPLSEIIEEVKSGKSLYKREMIQELLDQAQKDGNNLSDKALTVIKDIDGTEINISSEYTNINIIEFWGKCRKEIKNETGLKYSYEDSIVVLANEKVVLRYDQNPYGFIPFFSCRIKPRKYDFYGLGFCENVTDLQELTNSIVNLGFDSLKMCSMDIAMLDVTKVKDPASIDYRPMAIWKFKDDPRSAVSLTRQGISALNDILRGMTVLDQFMQEATGVMRQVQGAPQLGGGGSETLGEYQSKLAMIDNRFLKIARFIERDYIEPLLKGMFKILFNPKFFNQSLIDRIIGMEEIDVPMIDPFTGQPTSIKQYKSKIDFNQIAGAGEMGFDFKATGMTNFTKSIETLQKLKELLVEVVRTPQLMMISKIDEIYKRVLQAAEIQDYQELIKSDEEINQMMNQANMPPQAGVPQAGMPQDQNVMMQGGVGI